MAYEPHLIADMHAHVLPGVDHGAQSVEESISMLKESYKSGIRFICATHHYDARYEEPTAFLTKRDEAAKLLSENCAHLEVPKLVPGAEVKYFKNIGGFFDLSPFCIGDSRFVLIEPTNNRWDSTFFTDIEQIMLSQQIIPIIAHVERYGMQAPKNYMRILSDMGAVLQYNADYFMRLFPKAAIKRIPENAMVVFGSDMHNMTDRAPNLAPALKKCEKYMPERFFESARVLTEKIFKRQP